jgi:positive regulator of sigma E activity
VTRTRRACREPGQRNGSAPDAAREGADQSTTDAAAARWLTAALAEYQSLRAESLQAQQAQQTVLQFGITGVAVLIGLALNLEAKLLSILLLLYLVPLLSIFIISVWSTEIFRSIRAGEFISHLERKINDQTGGDAPALEWESWLRAHPTVRRFARDRMSFAVLFTLNVAGLVLAGYLAREAHFRLEQAAAFVVALAGAHLVLLVALAFTYVRSDRRVRDRSVLITALPDRRHDPSPM